MSWLRFTSIKEYVYIFLKKSKLTTNKTTLANFAHFRINANNVKTIE